MSATHLSNRTTLGELAKLIRSKNARPFTLTFDVMFDTEEVYRRVLRSGVLTKTVFAELYRIPEQDVMFFAHDAARDQGLDPAPGHSGRQRRRRHVWPAATRAAGGSGNAGLTLNWSRPYATRGRSAA